MIIHRQLAVPGALTIIFSLPKTAPGATINEPTETLIAMPPDKFESWCSAQLDTDFPIKTPPTEFDRILRERFERNVFTTDKSCSDLIDYWSLYEEQRFDAMPKTPARPQDYYPKVQDLVAFLQKHDYGRPRLAAKCWFRRR